VIQEADGLKELQPPQGNGEIILVVDDEAPIARLASLVLNKNGYKVLSAADGSAALVLYREYAEEIKVVLTDVMMPVMDGVKLARALKEINPGVIIIASSGQATETRQEELHALGVNRFLHKPYDSKMLLSMMHDLIHLDQG
jgi:CheY-like chemotaxis protein